MASAHMVATDLLPAVDVVKADPSDNVYLATALAGGARWVVSGNTRHRNGKPRSSVPASSAVSVVGTRFGTRYLCTFDAGLSCVHMPPRLRWAYTRWAAARRWLRVSDARPPFLGRSASPPSPSRAGPR